MNNMFNGMIEQKYERINEIKRNVIESIENNIENEFNEMKKY